MNHKINGGNSTNSKDIKPMLDGFKYNMEFGLIKNDRGQLHISCISKICYQSDINAHKEVGCSKTQFPQCNIKKKKKKKNLSKTVRINFDKSLENSQMFTKVTETLNQEKAT